MARVIPGSNDKKQETMQLTALSLPAEFSKRRAQRNEEDIEGSGSRRDTEQASILFFAGFLKRTNNEQPYYHHGGAIAKAKQSKNGKRQR